MYKNFDLKDINLTKYMFFTGKGGVGKTSIACSIAVNLADSGKKIMLVMLTQLQIFKMFLIQN